MGFWNNLLGGGLFARGQKGSSSDEETQFLQKVQRGIAEMQDQLNRLVRASADALSHQNGLEADAHRCQQQVEEWQLRARQALQAGDEPLARKALERKAEVDRQLQNVQPALETARQSSQQILQQIEELRQQIGQAQRDASVLVARRNAALAQRKMARAMAGMDGPNNAFEAIRKFEDDVATREAEARAFESLNASLDSSTATTPSPDRDPRSVDDQLAALRREVEDR